MKKKIEDSPKFTPFSELKFTLDPVLYDTTKEQTVPLTINAFTPQGFRSGYAAHRLKPLSDARFFQQEAEFEKLAKPSFEPVKKLWLDLVIERIGYKAKPNWKSLVTDDDITRIFTISRKFDLELEQSEAEDEEFDDSGETCLKFRAFYGGITADEWKEWLTKGNLPLNIELDETAYDVILELLQKGIAPSAELILSFFIPKTSYADNLKFFEIQEGKSKNKMASQSKDRRTKAEQLAEFYDDLGIKSDGYSDSPPALHKGFVLQNYFAVKAAILGKS